MRRQRLSQCHCPHSVRDHKENLRQKEREADLYIRCTDCTVNSPLWLILSGVIYSVPLLLQPQNLSLYLSSSERITLFTSQRSLVEETAVIIVLIYKLNQNEPLTHKEGDRNTQMCPLGWDCSEVAAADIFLIKKRKKVTSARPQLEHGSRDGNNNRLVGYCSK